MKPFVKYALAGIALAGASMSAYADVAAPSSGNSEILLIVRDLSAPSRVFTTGIGVTLDQLLPQSAIDPANDATLRNGQPIATSAPGLNFSSAALTSFMSVSSALGYEYALLGGDTVGDNTAGNAVRVLATNDTQYGTGLLSGTTYSNINPTGGVSANMQLFFDETNGLLPDSPGSFITNGTFGAATGAGNTAPTLFANPSNFNDVTATAGTATNLYMLTSGGSSSGRARLYQFADVTLSLTGVLSSAGGSTPEVPLPAAVWLLGSALVGLGTVRRRRNAEVAA